MTYARCQAYHGQLKKRCENLAGHTVDHRITTEDGETLWFLPLVAEYPKVDMAGALHYPEGVDQDAGTVFPPSDPAERVAAARDSQVGGSHYQRAIQIWDIVQVWELDYFRGSALKYLLRAGSKGPALEDFKKARHVLDKLIEIEEGKDG